MEHAIITDVRYRMSLPVIRSLGQAGLTITAADLEGTDNGKSLGFYSRYTSKTLLLPDPESTDYLNALKNACGDTKPAIFPVGIDSLLALCKAHDTISAFADVALPPYDSILLANDKASLACHANFIGVPVPKTTTLTEGETVDQLAKRISYPVVIKYRAGELLRLDPQNRYFIANDSETFKNKFLEMHSMQEYPLVQQYISGDGYGVSAVFDKDSNPLSVFCHRRIREYPISGGPSAMCISTWEENLVDHAIKLLKSLHWIGVAMVEFKGNPETGFYLMEINPRFWGSLALAPAAGCDIPLAYYHACRGVRATSIPTPTPSYKIGKKMHFILQDVLSFRGYYKNSNNKLSYTLKFIQDLLNPAVADGVFSFHDLRSSLQYFKQALRKTDKIIR